MAATRVPEVLSITDPDGTGGQYECYEGRGGYFDGTVFEVPMSMTALVLHVARRTEDGDKDIEHADRYIYRLDPEQGTAEYLRCDMIARDPR